MRKAGGADQLSGIAENIGVSKSSAQAAVSWPLKRKLLAVSKDNATQRHGILC
jgi:hypothetical protein